MLKFAQYNKNSRNSSKEESRTEFLFPVFLSVLCGEKDSSEYFQPLARALYQHVWRGSFEGVRCESVGASDGIDFGILRGDDIDFRVANQHRFCRLALRVLEQCLHAQRIGLLGFEAVAAVNPEEKIGQSQGFGNGASWAHGLVAEDCHLASVASGVHERAQRVEDTIVYIRVVELVLAIIIEKELQCDMNEVLVLRIAERAPHQHGSAIADVAGDHVEWQFVPAKVAQCRIYGIAQVLARVHQRSVKVKDQQPQLADRNFTIDLHQDQCIWRLTAA